MENNNKCDRCNTKNTSNANYCAGCGYKLSNKKEEEIVETVPPQPKSRVSTSALIGIVVGVSFMFGLSFFVQQLLFKAPSIDDVMMKSASEINRHCPVMIDNETMLNNTIALPNKVFQYNYTLVNLNKKDIDTVELKKTMEPLIINDLKTNPKLKYQRENKVTMSYQYRDKAGQYICVIIVNPQDYN